MTYTDEQVFSLVQSVLFNIQQAEIPGAKVALHLGIAKDLLTSIIINMRSEK